jgi:hypothetical protein
MLRPSIDKADLACEAESQLLAELLDLKKGISQGSWFESSTWHKLKKRRKGKVLSAQKSRPSETNIAFKTF